MNSLLETLRNEVQDLRSQSCQLTRQMWLLYVTFEDFICIRHPDRSAALISSTVDIDTYFSGPLTNNRTSSANSFSAYSCPFLQKEKACSHYKGALTSHGRSTPKDQIQTGPSQIGHLPFRAESSAFMIVQRKSDSHGEDSHSSHANQTLSSANAINHLKFDSGLETDEKQSLSKHNVVEVDISDCAHQNNWNQKERSAREKKQVTGLLSYSEVDRDRGAVYEGRYPVFIFHHQLNQNYQSGTHNNNNKGWRQNTQRRCDLVCRTQSIEFLQMHNTDLQGRYHSNDVRNGLNTSAFCGSVKHDRVNRATRTDIKSACIQNVNNIKDKSRDYILGENNPQSEQPCTTKFDNFICQQEGSETSSVCSQHDTDDRVHSDSSRQARLRVSVFDHSRIPSKITSRILAARRLEQGLTAVDENDSQDNTQNSVKSPDNDFTKRRGFYVPYAVIKTSKSSESAPENSQEGDTDPASMKDTLKSKTSLEELLEFVKDSVSNDTSPMTISSGYESDYMQTKENKTDSYILSKAAPSKTICHRDEVPTDYFSMSDTYLKSEVPSPGNAIMQTEKHGDRTHTASKSATLLRGPGYFMSLDEPKTRSGRVERDSQEFSYAQRHNYKLTKVTRSMYEIIHDLQAEKGQLDSRKKVKKGRRDQHSKESAITLNRDGTSSLEDNALHERLNPRVFSAGPNKKPAYSSSNKNNTDNSSKPATSAFCIRCVRRPLGTETAVRRQRQGNSEPSTESDNGSKFERQLRTLLCDSPELVQTDCIQNSIKSPEEALHEQAEWKMTFMNENESSQNFQQDTVVTGIVLRGAVNKIRHSGKEDEHVYETIPGDEYMYEEMKRIREASSGNRIRRFTTVPDLPGTFIPKEPPALPERRYPRELRKYGENFISVPDENSNYTKHPSFPWREYPHISPVSAGSGYASISIESILEANFSPDGEDISAQDRGAFESHSKGDDSDGYCSIDTTSLMQHDTGYEKPWGKLYPLLESNSEPSTSQLRNLSNDGWQARPSHFQCSRYGDRTISVDSETSNIDIRLHGMKLLENGKSDSSDSDSTLVPSSFDGHETRRPIVQATYV